MAKCIVKDCDNQQHCRGLCQRHYYQSKTDKTIPIREAMTIQEIGRLGGKVSGIPKGFGSDRALAIKSGRKGGRISRRVKSGQ